ncbi:retropepsin-like aspartic protease [Salipaludibacillus daqingensis]|uniref:retropepsin-like aspartic protease n=1 Tax=Salipaludibacillus daqingensis TaxID=3041001 RepID=UPI002474E95A|nr:retropepsin-like aspartic protease [Salipaludibacillus daqingensis]
MKPIHNDNGKLYTEMRLKFQGKIHTTETMLVDTSSSVTIISHQLAEILGFKATDDQTVILMDSISVGPLKVSDFPIEVKDIEEEGIIGIDFLIKVGAKINLDSMTISSSRT